MDILVLIFTTIVTIFVTIVGLAFVAVLVTFAIDIIRQCLHTRKMYREDKRGQSLEINPLYRHLIEGREDKPFTEIKFGKGLTGIEEHSK